MKRVLVIAALALAAAVLYTTTAPAGQQAVTPKQFTALQKRVKKLETDSKDLKDAVGIIIICGFDQGAIPVTKTPSFHVTATGEATDFYALTTSRQECVQFINSPASSKLLRRLGR